MKLTHEIDLTDDLRDYFNKFGDFIILNNNVYRIYKRKDNASILQYVVPKSERKEIFEQLHSSCLSGHLYYETTINRIQDRFYWPRYTTDVKEWCKECLQCSLVKTGRKIDSPLVPIRENEPFGLITTDICGPFNRSGWPEKRYILVIVDHFTKWVELYALENQNAKTVARCICEYISRHSCPYRILDANIAQNW